VPSSHPASVLQLQGKVQVAEVEEQKDQLPERQAQELGNLEGLEEPKGQWQGGQNFSEECDDGQDYPAGVHHVHSDVRHSEECAEHDP
jgi:hypothetical protein